MEPQKKTREEHEERLDEYVIAQRIGGGDAREMACEYPDKLVPWGGVAAHVATLHKEGTMG